MTRCLVCYNTLGATNTHYHPKCAQRLYGQKQVPKLAINQEQLNALAEASLKSGLAVTGVQPKLSLHLDRAATGHKLTLVGANGNYILKPQTSHFLQLPENEHLTMLLAHSLGVDVAACGLVYLEDDSLAYITRRFDRLPNETKLGMEDFAQLLGVLSEYKNRSSTEKVAKGIAAYSQVPGLDKVQFFLLTLHTFLTGNADMHLKNFALLETTAGWRLSPAYDLVNTRLAMPTDKEQFALPLRGKKNRLLREDLVDYLGAEVLGLVPKVIANVMAKIEKALPLWPGLIRASFLTDVSKETYLEIVRERAEVLGLAFDMSDLSA